MKFALICAVLVLVAVAQINASPLSVAEKSVAVAGPPPNGQSPPGGPLPPGGPPPPPGPPGQLPPLPSTTVSTTTSSG